MGMASTNKRRYCCYRGCYSVKALSHGGRTSFYSFPTKDTERCSKWISNCGREEFRYLTPRELTKKRICEQHFDSHMFSNDLKTGLLKNALPKDCRKSSVPEGAAAATCDEERESGINTADSSDNNENEFTCPKESSSILCTALKGEKESGTRSKDSSEYVNLNGKKSSSNESNTHGKCSYANKTLSNHSAVLSQNTTKFHNLPLQATHTDFYYQQCQSADETNNSFPEPADGELPLFVQQEYDTSEADDPVNGSVASEPLSKKVKYDKDNSDLANLVKETVKQLKHITSTASIYSEDEFEVFGRSVAIQLKKMSLCTALTVQSKIQDLLSQFRIKDIIKSELKTVLTDSDKRIPLVDVNGEENNCSNDANLECNRDKESELLQPSQTTHQNSPKCDSQH